MVGNLKVIPIICSSVVIFGNVCTPLQVLGFLLTSCGVWVNFAPFVLEFLLSLSAQQRHPVCGLTSFDCSIYANP